jgi:hypothetical protein
MRVVNAGLNRDPDDMAALMIGACVVSREGAWGMAMNMLKRVKEQSPPFPEIYNNLGMCLSSLASNSGKDKYLDEAESLLRKAFRKHPIPEVISNLALVLMHQGKVQAAEQMCREGLAKDPSNVSLRETLGYACLYQGNWIEGFGNYEFNLGNKFRKVPHGTYWERGLRSKRLFVQGEQGIGDEISYASILPQASQDNTIAYECDHRLAGLMRRSLPGVEVHGTRFSEDKGWRAGREFDAVSLTGSLCMEYRRTDEDFPRKGFLVPDPERWIQWRSLLDTLPGRKIGIAWTGGLDTTFKSRRSFSLEALLPILKTPGVTWVSLQYTAPEGLDEFCQKHGITIKHWARAVEKGCDYDETAALIANLDAVVSVTTAVVHLCGALGKKCYVLVPKKARWFYASNDHKHRWYSSLELFRQEDKWPVERVAERLKEDLV